MGHWAELYALPGFAHNLEVADRWGVSSCRPGRFPCPQCLSVAYLRALAGRSRRAAQDHRSVSMRASCSRRDQSGRCRSHRPEERRAPEDPQVQLPVLLIQRINAIKYDDPGRRSAQGDQGRLPDQDCASRASPDPALAWPYLKRWVVGIGVNNLARGQVQGHNEDRRSDVLSEGKAYPFGHERISWARAARFDETYSGLGIHGTWEPQSIGTCSKGYRMRNEDVEDLHGMVPTGPRERTDQSGNACSIIWIG